MVVAHVEKVSICPTVVSSPVIGVSSATNTLDQEFIKLIEHRTATEYVRAVIDILGQYKSICVVRDEPTGYTDYMPFHITTEQTKPIVQRPYRILIAYQAVSPWSLSMVLVKQENGGLRFCVDYCQIYEVTVGESFPSL